MSSSKSLALLYGSVGAVWCAIGLLALSGPLRFALLVPSVGAYLIAGWLWRLPPP